MAAGDIILENGGTVTASDIQQIAAAVKSQLASESKDLSQYENVETLSGVSSLPGFMESGATKKLVRVALSVLKGVDGKTPEITSDGQAIKWRYTGETQWNTLVQLSLLKGDKGEDGEKVQLRKGDTGIEWKYEDEEAWNTLVPMADLSFTYDELTDEQKQEISKKPILSEVSATAGDTASGSFSPDGTDEQGNPKYVLNLVSPRGEKGETGKTPILQKGTITTLEPTEEATFELVQSGTDGSGNPIYKINLGLPKGNPGDGSGNVYVDPSGLTGGKQYVFQPTSDGSATGTFHPIENATDESNGLMSKEEHSKLGAMKEVIRFPKEIFNLTDASETEDIRSAFGMNHMNIYSMFINICSFWDIDGAEEYAKKCYIGNYECLLGYEYKGTSPAKCTLHFIINDKGKIRDIAVSSFIEDSNYVLTCKVTESGGGADDTYWLPTEVYNLKSGATKEEILTAIGDTTALQNALDNGKKIYIKGPVFFSIVNIPVSISILTNLFQISFPYVLNTNSYAAEKIIQVSANDGYVKLIYFGGYELKPEVYTLTSSSSSEDISTAVGGESGLKNIIQAIKDGNRLVIRGTNDSLGDTVVNQDLICNGYEESENGDISLMISGIGYGLFGGFAGILAISYTKSSNTFLAHIRQ